MSEESNPPGEQPAAPKNWNNWRNLLNLAAVRAGIGLMVTVFSGDYVPRKAMDAVDVAFILAPVIAASAAIERSIETIFDWVETRSGSVVAFLARSEAWIGHAEEAVETSRSKYIAAANAINENLARQIEKVDDLESVKALETKARAKLDILNQQVDRAEGLLSSVTTRSPTYRQAKRLWSLYISFAMGLLIASLGSVQMLHLLGIFKAGGPGLLTKVDVVITGIVMATGSGPVHSLINILQQGKEALENASGFLESRKNNPPTSEKSAS